MKRKELIYMTNEEIIELIHKDVNTSENMGLLYEQNKGTIYKIAKKYATFTDIDDLIQEAYFGLYEAVKNYENNNEIKFITYATFWIRQSIQRYVENNASTIRTPVYLQNLHYKYNKVVNAFIKEHNRKPTDREASRLLDTSIKKIQDMKKTYDIVGNVESLDQSIAGDNEEIRLSNSIIGLNGIENDIVDKIIEKDIKSSLWGIIEKNTSEKENKIINSRYKEGLTLEAIGKELGVTRERVRQIESVALKKLRTSRVQRMLSERYGIAMTGAYRGSLGSFKHTWTSSTEKTALKLYRLR